MNKPLAAADVLKPEAIHDYRAQIDLVWTQVVQLNAHLYLLEKIAEFPFDLFLPTNDLCWVLFAEALYDSSLMAISRLVVDQAGDLLTIRHVKNYVFTNAKSGGGITQVQDELRALNFDAQISNTQEVIRELRHKWVAHLRRDTLAQKSDGIPSVPVVPVRDLKAVAHSICDLIEAISFDAGRSFIYPEYDPNVTSPRTADPRTDIERLLDWIAEKSDLLHAPEDQPEVWTDAKAKLNEESLKVFNVYRSKLGLPSV